MMMIILVPRMDWLLHSIQIFRRVKKINVPTPIENLPPSEIRNLLIQVSSS